jgi:hypothetical protein
MPGTYIDVGANATYANNTSNTNENEYQSIFVVPKSTIRLPIHFCCAKIHNPAPNPGSQSNFTIDAPLAYGFKPASNPTQIWLQIRPNPDLPGFQARFKVSSQSGLVGH